MSDLPSSGSVVRRLGASGNRSGPRRPPSALLPLPARAGTGRSVRTGVRWTAPTQFGMQVARIGTTIALSRMIDPGAFGLVALVTVVTGFFERVLGDTGTTTALVRSPDLTHGLASTVLFWNLLVGSLTSLVFFAGADPIAGMLGSPGASNLVRVLGAMAAVNATTYVQTALMRRRMRFRHLAMVNVTNVAITGSMSLGLAATGMGAMALALGSVGGSAASAALAWLLSDWRPAPYFSWAELRKIARFSSSLSLQNLFGYFSFAGDRLIIGRLLGVTELGYYGMANRLLRYPVQTSAQTYREVMLPNLARLQDDHAAMREAYRRTVAGIAFALFPLCFTVAAVADPLVATTLGARWRPASILVAIVAVVSALQSIATTTGSLYLAKGRADLSLRWAVGSSVVLMACYSTGAHWGVEGVAWGYLGGILMLLYPAFWLPLRLIDAKPATVFRSLGPAMPL